MKKKLINNPDITNWLNQFAINMCGTDIDAYVAECIRDQLYQFSPAVYARDEYTDTSFVAELPYITTRNLFGKNFIGLIADDGKDYSHIVEFLDEHDTMYSNKEGYYEYNEKVYLDRYYEFENCKFAIRLDKITVYHVMSSVCTTMPEVNIHCDIVRKDD